MVKVIVISDFNLAKFNELKNLERANKRKNAEGSLYINDKFECTQEMAEYLMKKNLHKKSFVKIIEVIPEKTKIETTKSKIDTEENEVKPKRKTTIKSKLEK